MSNKGGKRNGAGRKSNWNTASTGTTLIRVPTVLAEALMAARNNNIDIDRLAKSISPHCDESVTQSNRVNYWRGETQCQCLTAAGRRCRKPGKMVINHNGGEYLACNQHYESGFKPIPL